MKYTVRATDGHYIETDQGVEQACSLAMDRASEIERTGDVCGWPDADTVVSQMMTSARSLSSAAACCSLSRFSMMTSLPH